MSVSYTHLDVYKRQMWGRVSAWFPLRTAPVPVHSNVRTYDAALSFETLHHFKYEKKQIIYNKLFQSIKNGGYYIECDYFACCDEEEQLCLKEYEYKRRKSNIADSAFVHIDIPLTFEHQCDLLRNAGFINIRILHQNDSTVIIRAEKRIDNIE